MACAALQPSADKICYLKYISLLNDGGKLVLLEKLRNSVPNNDIQAHLKSNLRILDKLVKQKVISNTQYDLLYPQTGQVDPSKFDITLLTCLLKSTCGLKTKSTVWNHLTPPVDADISVGADVVRLRNWRNKIIGHPEKTSLSTTEFTDKWESLEKVLLRLGGTISNLSSQIAVLKSQTIDPIREAELQHEIEAWKDKFELLEDGIKDMKEIQEDMLQKHDTIAKAQGKFEQTQEDLIRKYNDVLQAQTSLQQQQYDIQQTRADINKTQELDIQDIRRTLVELYKTKCQRIPVYPLIPNITEDLESLYVEPNMETVDIRGDNPVYNKRPVSSYKDIFYKENKPCKNIYITGDVGIGKSTFCEKLVQTWCRAFEQSDDTKLTQDERVIGEYYILFYISLRYALEDISIEQMISSQLGLDDTTAKRLLKTERCLVVLDGLDEWVSLENAKESRFVSKGLPERSPIGNFTVLTTCRPWKLEQLRLREPEIDYQISITALTQTQMEKVSNRLLKVMNDFHDTKKQVADFTKLIEERGLESDLKTFVILSMMTCLWYYDDHIGDSKCDIYSKMIDKQIELALEQKKIQAMFNANHQSGILPSCFKNKASCQRYGTLLLSLSKLAFDTLFNENRESSVVFDHKDTGDMSPSDMTLCLKMGLLTQNIVFDSFVKKSKSISFIHKSQQEFFSAVYLATLDHDTAKDLLTKKGSRQLGTFLDMSNVILFLNGMNSKLGDDILSHIRELADTDIQVLDYRRDTSGPFSKNRYLVKTVQSLIIACEIERRENELPDSSQTVDDIVVFSLHDHCNPLYDATKTRNVLASKRPTSLSLFIPSGSTSDAIILWKQVFDCAKQSDKLQKMYIYDCCNCLSMEDIYSTVIKSCKTLTCLVLCRVDVSCLGKRLGDILTKPRLRSIGLGEYIDMTHDQIDIVSNVLFQATCISDLRLARFQCKTHSRDQANCTRNYKMPKNDALRALEIRGHIDSFHINVKNLETLYAWGTDRAKDLLECLRGSPKLVEIEIESETGHMDDKTGLVESIPKLTAVRVATLTDMDFTGTELRFPKSIEYVHLERIRINNSSLRCMLDDLPTHKVELLLREMDIILDTDGEESVNDYIRRSDKLMFTRDDSRIISVNTAC